MKEIREWAKKLLNDGDKRTIIRLGYFVFTTGLVIAESTKPKELILQWKEILELPKSFAFTEDILITNAFYDDDNPDIATNNFTKSSVDSSIDKIASFFWTIDFYRGLDRIKYDREK